MNPIEAEKICRNCEFWDGGGEKAAKVAETGDCLNSRSPRFTTTHDFTCDAFLASSTTNQENS